MLDTIDSVDGFEKLVCDYCIESLEQEQGRSYHCCVKPDYCIALRLVAFNFLEKRCVVGQHVIVANETDLIGFTPEVKEGIVEIYPSLKIYFMSDDEIEALKSEGGDEQCLAKSR